MPTRIQLAIVANEQAPYRVHFHRRIVSEMPDVRLWSLFTDEVAGSPWRYRADPEIGAVRFGDPQRVRRSVVGSLAAQWARGAAITRWLESHKVDAVILYGYNDATRLRIIRWTEKRQVPCFLFGDSNIRCDVIRGPKRLIKRLYVPWVLRRMTGIFHCGTLGREYFLRYGAPGDRLYSVPYEPDYSLFAGAAERGGCADERYGSSAVRKRLLFVGRMVASKRPDLILSAFQTIAGERPEWDLVMAGDGPLLPHLRATIRPDLENRIRWAGFIAEPADLAALYADSDVFVLPSDFEPWGVVVTEAAASGLALIASSTVGAAADLIRDGVNGRIFPAGSLDGLVKVLLEITRPSHTPRMRDASRAILSAWRTSNDPVRNLRSALKNANLLPANGLVHAG